VSGPPPAAPPPRDPALSSALAERWQLAVAALALLGIAAHLALRLARAPAATANLPLLAVLLLGGAPLVYDLAKKLARGELGSDLLAGISIVASALLGQHLAGALVVLMLSGGAALERLAVGRASSVLRALAKRMPSVAHARRDGRVEDVRLEDVRPGDRLVVFPHEVCPVDGVVLEGRGVMDESYLTGEPFEMSKAPGAEVISGAVNGASALAIRAVRPAVESRYARIMAVMRDTEARRPRLRRIADRLGALYTPLAVAIAAGAWAATGDPVRFLAVVVIATPCPLIIAIPVAVIGAISLAAKRSIVVKNPAILEQIDECRTIIFDKTGTLTYGAPRLTDESLAAGVDGRRLLGLAASLERYSKHPLAGAVLAAAEHAGVPLEDALEMSERPGEGLRGRVGGHDVLITGRGALAKIDARAAASLPPVAAGLECVALVDGRFAGLYRFHDAPREESRAFVGHLGKKHRFRRVLLVSGDRAEEVAYLAGEVGIREVHAGKAPEEKVAIVVEETRRAPTLFVGDGINDAPALVAASVGVALGQRSEVTSEAAGAVVMDATLARVDELFHIARRMRRIALESAVGGMAASVLGMAAAAAGLLTPVAGALAQEVIDVVAVLNALRVALPPREATDF
jgi:heavy metal translocating P-type ATPase